MWYADPQDPGRRKELLKADFTVRKAKNAIALGINAVFARIQHGRLKILAGDCPNLLAEAELYSYADDPYEESKSEKPQDKYNHALDALRYLVASIDANR